MFEWWNIFNLKSANAGTREKAARFLGDHGGRRAVTPLIAALKDSDSDVRWRVASALGEIGDVRAVEPLVAALKDSDDRVRWNATAALGKIGDTRAVEPLIAAMQDRDQEVREGAANALNKIGWTPTNTAQRIMWAIVRRNWDDVGKEGTASLEPLCAALKDSDADVRENAACALGQIGDARAVEALSAALKDSEADLRRAAAIALGKIEDARAIDPLSAALKDSDIDVREIAACALGQIGDARAVEPLIAALNDSEGVVRQEAARALGEIGDARAVEPLVAALKTDDWFLRKQAALALGKITWQPTGAEQRVMWAIALENWKELVNEGPASVEPLIAVLMGTCELNACVSVCGTLGRIGDARAIEPLIAVLTNPSIVLEVRESAARALGQMGDARAVEPLSAALKDSNVREKAAEALAKIRATNKIQATNRMTWSDIDAKYGQCIPQKPIDSESYKAVLSTFYRDYAHADRVLSDISNEIAGELVPTNEDVSSLTGAPRYHMTHEGRLTGAQVKEYLITIVQGGGEIFEVLL